MDSDYKFQPQKDPLTLNTSQSPIQHIEEGMAHLHARQEFRWREDSFDIHSPTLSPLWSPRVPLLGRELYSALIMTFPAVNLSSILPFLYKGRHTTPTALTQTQKCDVTCSNHVCCWHLIVGTNPVCILNKDDNVFKPI